MSFLATALKRHGLALFFLGAIFIPARAQTPPPDRPVLFNDQDGITTSFVTAPSLSTGTFRPPPPANGNDNQWLKVELHYSVTTKADQPGFLPAVTFKIWIEGRDLFDPRGKPREGIAVALTGSVTYVNIPSGKDNYAVFYVHPNTLARYSTNTGYTDFDRKFNIHVEADIDGQLSDYYDKTKEQDLNWFKALTPITGVVYRHDQCAFLLDSPDRYPAIKLEDQSSSSDSAPATPPAPSAAPSPNQ